jgi:hypothetical protein
MPSLNGLPQVETLEGPPRAVTTRPTPDELPCQPRSRPFHVKQDRFPETRPTLSDRSPGSQANADSELPPPNRNGRARARELPAGWDSVSVPVQDRLTVAFCRLQDAGVIVRSVHSRSDLRHGY